MNCEMKTNPTEKTPKRKKEYKRNTSKTNALPKIHKGNMPVSQIINYTHAPACKMVKHVNKILATSFLYVHIHLFSSDLERYL